MAPKTKEQFQEIRESTKAVIKEAALELFAHRGYASTSISLIAKEAGVSKGLMYNYFESKKALINEIILDAYVTTEAVLKDHFDPEKPAPEQLTGIVKGLSKLITENMEYWKLLTSLAFQEGGLGDMGDSLKQKSLSYLDLMTHLFNELGAASPKEEALLFSATLDGMMMHYMTMGEDYPVDAMEQYVIQRFCQPRNT
ncbi:MAG: TetR/AcrR family transcriptional regulator [Phaeodactylibacter sp.]|nr:TetR/AcrR family transcriptional regulator [Phaeodactylibacter sp.]